METIGTHTIQLNTPPWIHPVFHVDLLQPASQDPLPSQHSDDYQPLGVIVNNYKEYQVKKYYQ